MAGTYGGWEPSDSHRKLVSETVAESGADESLSSFDAIVTVNSVDWEYLTRFIECGQFYE